MLTRCSRDVIIISYYGRGINMAKYDFFISYARKDGVEYAKAVADILTKKGYTVWRDDMFLSAGFDYAESISEAIASSNCLLPIVTDAYTSSPSALNELVLAFECSKKRAKMILPLIISSMGLPFVDFYAEDLYCIQVGLSDDIFSATEKMVGIYERKRQSEISYEKLLEFKNIGNSNKIAATICDLINLTVRKWEHSSKYAYNARHYSMNKKSVADELYRLYLELETYSGRYDDESRGVVHRMLGAIDNVDSMLRDAAKEGSKINLFTSHIYFVSIAIRIIYSDRSIRRECADVITSGDIPNACPVEMYIDKQKLFADAYARLIGGITEESELSDDEITFIKETESFIFKGGEHEKPSSQVTKQRHEEELTEKDEILLSVAKFMQEGNRLFDVLQSRGLAGDFLSCLLTSYERLKNYCEVVGATKVAADCVDRIVEIRDTIERADDTSADETVENGIKSLLGFTLKGSGSYDVFISFKSEDSDLAETIYNFCQQNLKVPFWSKRTLPQLSKSEYEDAIYDAINKSKHFIIVLSKLEYLNTNWIGTEMRTFHTEIIEGRKKDANFVFVVTDDVYKEIISSNKICLDVRYRRYQIIKMSEFKEILPSYLV